MALARRHVEAQGRTVDVETGRANEPDQTGEVVLPPPWPSVAIEFGDRSSGVDQRERQVDVVHQQHLPTAHGSDALESSHRVAQVEEQAADVDEVELAEIRRIQVVDAPLLEGDARAEHAVSHLKAPSPLL